MIRIAASLTWNKLSLFYYPDCTNDDIRLLAYNGNNYLEYCYQREWRQIKKSGCEKQNFCRRCRYGVWTGTEARVACKQLGYSGEGIEINTYNYVSETSIIIFRSPIRFFKAEFKPCSLKVFPDHWRVQRHWESPTRLPRPGLQLQLLFK